MQLIDTHAHLDMEPFAEDLPDVLQRARESGVAGICAIGCTPESSERCCQLARQYPDQLRAAVGIQPNYVHQAQPDWMEQVIALSERPEVVAIGETGLDCYWDDSPLPQQREFFQRHLELSRQTGKPLVIHMRDSGREIHDQLRAAGLPAYRGIMHSFTGDWELAEQFLALGLHISFAGMVTFKKSDALRALAARIPADRLLVETDAPYLSPEPLRGKRPNEPARVVHTARVIAEARGVELAELAAQTTENACRLFDWVPGACTAVGADRSD
jgi:TatD DNase family protein